MLALGQIRDNSRQDREERLLSGRRKTRGRHLFDDDALAFGNIDPAVFAAAAIFNFYFDLFLKGVPGGVIDIANESRFVFSVFNKNRCCVEQGYRGWLSGSVKAGRRG